MGNGRGGGAIEQEKEIQLKKNALTLARDMSIDLKHLKEVWDSFRKREGIENPILFNLFINRLNEKEKDYLIYLGLNSISIEYEKHLSYLFN